MKIVLDTPVSSVIFTTRPHGRREAELAPDKGKAIMPVDVSRALDLKINHDLSYSNIGAIEGVSKQRIHQLLKPLLPDKDLIDPFKDKRGDIIAYAQFKALRAYLSLDDDEQKEMIKRRGLVDMGIAFDKERLERDLSTANLATLTSDIAAYKRAKVVDNSGGRDGPTGK